MNLVKLTAMFPDDDSCRAYLERIRWPNGVRCPRCDGDKISRLDSRRQFTCTRKACRFRFSVTAGTIFHKSRIGLRKWFLAVYLMSDAKKSVSSLQLSRELRISTECAWHMTMRIREAMREDHGQTGLFRGITEADEYYHGGRPRKGTGRKNPTGRGTKKQPILGVKERDTGRIRTSVIPGADKTTLTHELFRLCDLPETELHTDQWFGYRMVGRLCRGHKTVNHVREYVSPDNVHVNGVENAWSLFSRSVMGAFHHISVKHLPRYLHEFDSRFNARHPNGGYFERILRQSDGRRLTMDDLVRNGGRKPLKPYRVRF